MDGLALALFPLIFHQEFRGHHTSPLYRPTVVKGTACCCQNFASGVTRHVSRGGDAAPVRRETAYGIFNTGYGIAWFLGSVRMGVLYDVCSHP